MKKLSFFHTPFLPLSDFLHDPIFHDYHSLFLYLFPAANRILHPAQRMSVHTIHMELSPVFGDLPVRVVFTSSYTKAYVEKPSVANVN